MTAERLVQPDGVLVGYIGDHPEFTSEPIGRLSDLDFDFNGTTYRVYGLTYVLADETGAEAIAFVLSQLDHHALERMTLNVDGYMLHVSDSDVIEDANRNPRTTFVVWVNPGFDWRDGQRVDVALTMAAQPVPALPLAAAGFLALLLALSAYRRGASRN